MATKNPVLLISSPNTAAILLPEVIAVNSELKDDNQIRTGDATGGVITRTLNLYAVITFRNRSTVRVFMAAVSESFEKNKDRPFDLAMLQALDAKLVGKAQNLFLAQVVAPWEAYLKAIYDE